MIIINGKELKTKFTFYAIEQEETIPTTPGSRIGYILKAMWGGYCGYCLSQKQQPLITVDELIEWIDANFVDENAATEIGIILGERTNSFAYQALMKKGLKKIEDDEKKKKAMIVDIPDQLPGMTSTPSFGEQSELSPKSTTT